MRASSTARPGRWLAPRSMSRVGYPIILAVATAVAASVWSARSWSAAVNPPPGTTSRDRWGASCGAGGEQDEAVPGADACSRWRRRRCGPPRTGCTPRTRRWRRARRPRRSGRCRRSGRNHGSTIVEADGPVAEPRSGPSGMSVVSVGVQPSSGCRSATRCASAGPASSATRCRAAGTPEVTAAVVVTDPSSTYRRPRTQCTAGRLAWRALMRDQWLVAWSPSSIPVAARTSAPLQTPRTLAPSSCWRAHPAAERRFGRCRSAR